MVDYSVTTRTHPKTHIGNKVDVEHWSPQVSQIINCDFTELQLERLQFWWKDYNHNNNNHAPSFTCLSSWPVRNFCMSIYIYGPSWVKKIICHSIIGSGAACSLILFFLFLLQRTKNTWHCCSSVYTKRQTVNKYAIMSAMRSNLVNSIWLGIAFS